MQTPRSKTAATDALVGLWAIALTSFVIATLYFARDFLIPLALAALLTFLLSPLVTRIERWLGRITAVLLVGAMILRGYWGGGLGAYPATGRSRDEAAGLQRKHSDQATFYQGSHRRRVHTILRDGRRAEERIYLAQRRRLRRGAAKPQTPVAVTPRPAPAAASVQVVETSSLNPMGLVQYLIAPLLGPLGKAALVVLLVIFMLLRREDLRRRLIRLIGKGHISAATHAMEDAGARVFRYLLMQLVVNVSYGIPGGDRPLLHRRAECCAVGRICCGAPIHSLHRTVDRRCDYRSRSRWPFRLAGRCRC